MISQVRHGQLRPRVSNFSQAFTRSAPILICIALASLVYPAMSAAASVITPVLTLTATPASTTPGQATIVTLTVSGAAATPIGTVTFAMPQGESYTGQLANGVASIVLYSLTPATYVVTATYSGGANYAPSASAATVSFQVTPNPPALAASTMSWVPGSTVVQANIVWPDGIFDADSNTLGTLGYRLHSIIGQTDVPVVSLPTLMEKPLTVGPIFAAGSPIANLTPMSSPLFRYEGAVAGTAGTAWPGKLFYSSHSLSCPDSSMPFSAEFIVTSSWFELMQYGSGSQLRVWVDGHPGSRYNTIPALPKNGGFYLQRFDFGASATRRIRLQFGGGFWFGGIVTPNGSSDVKITDTSTGPPIIFFGDSYTEGAGATGHVSYAETVAESLGLNNVYASGCGGTGYLNPGGSNRVNFGGRLQADVIDQKPSLVIWAGGINDESASFSDIFNAALTDYQRLAEGLPGVQQVVVGPWSKSTPISSGSQTAHDAIRAAALAAGLPFIDNIEENWIVGSRRHPLTGNAYEYISSDFVHPTQAGHDYLGNRLALDLVPVLGLKTPAAGCYQMTATFTPSDDTTWSGASMAVQPFLVQGASPILLSPPSLQFIDRMVGTESDAASVTLTNLQRSALTFQNIQLTGGSAASFITSNNCGKSLAPGASCVLRVRFDPVADGAATASLTIADSATNSHQAITLTGLAVPRGVVWLSSTHLDFGNVTALTESAVQIVTVMNTESSALTFSGMALTGANAGSFLMSNNCGSTLAVGAMCTVRVRFKPASPGKAAAAVTLTDSAGNSPQAISLSGSGQ